MRKTIFSCLLSAKITFSMAWIFCIAHTHTYMNICGCARFVFKCGFMYVYVFACVRSELVGKKYHLFMIYSMLRAMRCRECVLQKHNINQIFSLWFLHTHTQIMMMMMMMMDWYSSLAIPNYMRTFILKNLLCARLLLLALLTMHFKCK